MTCATRSLRALAALLLATALAPAHSDTMTARIEPDPAVAWTAVNDAVMGGESEGRVARADDGTLLFAGQLSFANNGGFASARRPVALPADEEGRLEIACVGDGRRYKVALYTDVGGSGYSYQAELNTEPGVTTRVAFAWRDFLPRFRGRPLPDAPPLQPQRVRYLGFLIADRVGTPFRLAVDSITVVAGPTR
jgi:monofunctional biosynthetic peptidoglycan transglycosylase